MNRSNAVLLFAMSLVSVAAAQSPDQPSRKRPEVQSPTEPSFGRGAEKDRLDRLKAEIDQDEAEYSRDVQWIDRQIDDVSEAQSQNSAVVSELHTKINRWRCRNGQSVWTCRCGDAARYVPVIWPWVEYYEQERDSLEQQRKEIFRKRAEIASRGRLISERRSQLQADLREFKRTAQDEKRLEFDEFPKPKNDGLYRFDQ
jgi:hypothetical protein